MSARPPRIVISGAGAVSPFGAGVRPLLDGVDRGRGAWVRVPRAAGACARARLAAVAPAQFEAGRFPASAWRRLDRCSRMAVLAADEAIGSAGESPVSVMEAGVVLGTMTAGIAPLGEMLETRLAQGPDAVSPMLFPFTVQNAPASQCSILLALRGPNLTVCQMEASGLGAVAVAAALLRQGAADAVLAGGVDEHPALVGEAWRKLRITAPPSDPPAWRGPFDTRRRGFLPGEGAYVLFMETLERARARGARPWAEILGAAEAHAPGPAHGWPSGADEPARAVALALGRAGLAADDLGYIAAGANGSRRLDELEARALRQALGPALRRVPVSAIKGLVGESGAASAAAALTGALAIRDGFIPACVGLDEPDAALGLDYVRGAARRERVPSVLVNALGTGGSCVALVLSRLGP